MRCLFEEIVGILVEAAAVGKKDDCRGIVEKLCLGK